MKLTDFVDDILYLGDKTFSPPVKVDEVSQDFIAHGHDLKL